MRTLPILALSVLVASPMPARGTCLEEVAHIVALSTKPTPRTDWNEEALQRALSMMEPELRPFYRVILETTPGSRHNEARRILYEFAKAGGVVRITGADDGMAGAFLPPADGVGNPTLTFVSEEAMRRQAASLLDEVGEWSKSRETLRDTAEIIANIGPPEPFNPPEEYFEALRSFRALPRAHEAFEKAGGRLEIRPPEKKDDSAYFLAPQKAGEPPLIVLTSHEEIVNGVYEHELKHFRDWLSVKKAVIARKGEPDEAHVAYSEYKSDPERNARAVQWVEDHATERPGSYQYSDSAGYGQGEAIRRLADDASFANEARLAKSKTRARVADYLIEALDKQLLRWDRLGAEQLAGIVAFQADTPPRRRSAKHRAETRNAYLNLRHMLATRLDAHLDLRRILKSSLDRIEDADKVEAILGSMSSRQVEGHRKVLIHRELGKFRKAAARELRLLGYREPEIEEILRPR